MFFKNKSMQKYNNICWMICVLIVLIIIYFIIINKKYVDYFMNINAPNYGAMDFNSLNKCQVPSLNSDKCYQSKYFECPVINGSYKQCTNNYIPKPTESNCDCSNRTFDMCPYPFKLSEDCYYHKIGFDRNKFNLKV